MTDGHKASDKELEVPAETTPLSGDSESSPKGASKPKTKPKAASKPKPRPTDYIPDRSDRVR